MMHATRIIQLLFVVACIGGCGDPSQTVRPRPAPATETNTKEHLLNAVKEAQREAAATKPPKPAIALPKLDDWVQSELRSLPPDDHGFTVAYDHRTGVAVTLYQFTRGLRVIPDDLHSGPTQNEMKRAKAGIQQAVQLGYWQAAKETDSGIVPLGDSDKQALWSRHTLTVDGHTVKSDTYVWAHKNTLFKLRCTGRSQNVEAETKILAELLTALGKACGSNAE